MSIYTKIKLTKPGRNKFNLSHTKILSAKMGDIIPVLCREVVPGDKFRGNPQVMARFAPMLAPIMHKVDIKLDHFFIPTRLVWNQFQDFITRGREGTTEIIPPFITWDSATWDPHFRIGTLADYLGLPVDETGTPVNSMDVSALPFRAYQLLYNEYFRDQNVTPALTINLGSGDDTANVAQLCTLRKSAWQKDQFTSALPWPQRGPEVLIPMEGVATASDITYSNPSRVTNGTSGISGALSGNAGPGPVGNLLAGAVMATIENIDEIRSTNTSITLNALRYANKLQEWFEKNARGGSRYIEQILSHFGVKSSDARLQRPEYLAGSRQAVVVSEVLATATSQYETDPEDPDVKTTVPQGNMAGHGISVASNRGFKKFFEEHGFVFTTLRIIPRTGYQQGIEKMWSRKDTFDYYWPEFAHLGEEEISKKEIFYKPNTVYTEGLFGYQSRYYDYKTIFNSTHGRMRDQLNYWHLNRIFSSSPTLSTAFMEVDSATTKRIFAVQDPTVEDVYIQIHWQLDALRPMPYFGTPSL